MLRPLFPGRNASDQMSMICSVLGSPTTETWPDGLALAMGWNYQFPQFSGVHLSLLMPFASENVISLIKLLSSWDPSKRPTALEALKHPFFQDCYNNMNIPPSLPDLNDNSLTVTTLDDDDDQVPNKNNKVLENLIGKSKYGPIGEEERVLASSVESSLKLSQAGNLL
ncbi:hypothetical protein Ddye_014209 [Dipteronia dyeriana]|uniref:Uncharacterized protein n=1 Tax=Dipteronia dyeriana TaxID=168575 RepID=A0AAD9X8D9_9ROSI|nr:hypothetical protein Ddye_014209 [Dipteronia dyeriana]